MTTVSDNSSDQVPLPNLRHLEFGPRVALELRFAMAIVFRDGTLPSATEESIAFFRAKVLDALTIKSNYLRVVAKPPAGDCLNPVLYDLRALDFAEAGQCGYVIKKRVNTFLQHIDAMIEEASFDSGIPRDLEVIFNSMYNFVSNIYANNFCHELPLLRIFVELGDIHGHKTTDILDKTSVSASCRIDDRHVTSSIVRLGFRDDSFDWLSACQLPYILAHELLCHAFQGIGSTYYEECSRSMVDTTCAWSEGWMDVLAHWAVVSPGVV
jgi:hypothetical protein